MYRSQYGIRTNQMAQTLLPKSSHTLPGLLGGGAKEHVGLLAWSNGWLWLGDQPGALRLWQSDNSSVPPPQPHLFCEGKGKGWEER